MDKKKNKLFVWSGGAPFKGRLERKGPWRLLFKINPYVIIIVALSLLFWGYITTSQEECQAILKNPELYCPCMKEQPLYSGYSGAHSWIGDLNETTTSSEVNPG